MASTMKYWEAPAMIRPTFLKQHGTAMCQTLYVPACPSASIFGWLTDWLTDLLFICLSTCLFVFLQFWLYVNLPTFYNLFRWPCWCLFACYHLICVTQVLRLLYAMRHHPLLFVLMPYGGNMPSPILRTSLIFRNSVVWLSVTFLPSSSISIPFLLLLLAFLCWSGVKYTIIRLLLLWPAT